MKILIAAFLLNLLVRADFTVNKTDPAPVLQTAPAWSACGTTDSLGLVAFYNATNGPNWTTPWNLFQPMSSWVGVGLSASGCLDSLNLTAVTSGGQLLALDFPNLRVLNLSYNDFNGGIPNFNLPNLEVLDLQNNLLTGSIPLFDSMPKLKRIYLEKNRLTGSIPNFNLPNLVHLTLYDNRLTGAIPHLSMPGLIELGLGLNQLSGAVPPFTQAFRAFGLEKNRLTDCPAIPNFVGGAGPDDRFFISHNQLTFSDLLPNVFIFNNTPATYAPQDSVFSDTTITRNAGQSLTIDLGFDAAVGSNIYLWKKVGGGNVIITGINQRNFVNLSVGDAGDYYVEVTNPNLVDLTLYSRRITLQVGCIDVSNALPDKYLCQGSAFQFGNQTISQAGIYRDTLGTTGGCDSVVIQKVLISPGVNASVNPSGTLDCTTDRITLSAAAGTGISYEWTTTAGHIVSGATAASAIVDKGGSYQLVARNLIDGCADTVAVDVEQTGIPIAGIVLTADGPDCFGDENGTLTITNVGAGASPFQFSLNNNNVLQNSNVFSSLASGQYTVQVKGADGCTAQQSAVLDAPDSLYVTLAQPSPVQAGASVPLQASISGAADPVSYQWQGGALSCVDCPMPLASPDFMALYTLTVTDANGCSATASVAIDVNGGGLGPDMITPGNDDGKNDTLSFPELAEDPSKYQDNNILIFSRWGQVVYQAAPYANEWNGVNQSGQELPEGTYYYVLLLHDGEKDVIHGSVLLIR